ncbi:serine hydrolase [Flavivirga sp. 57AJ16]|uniref:serine hydrolase domain-containing protein n=1 Tax=Flavivirga sp. 57AJ16 TaxID=3025307 RepID=UPI00236581EC|nr:serine hydrolase domain-containing protein [Flavivirga sp. 57AJ16]MDD7888283.1 serine hydrolase [Flavivirga sp. 57AJ16]
MKIKNTIFYITLCVVILGCNPQHSTSIDEEISIIENSLIRGNVIKGREPKSFSIFERMQFHNVPGVSIAIVRDGKIRWAKGYGIANTNDSTLVNSKTLFQAGSISKPIAALAVLKLVEDKNIDIDEDVNTYLTSWKVPENKFTEKERVTLRKLMSHTAGVTVHGFRGYKPNEIFPTNEQVLNGEGNSNKVTIDTIPGSIWRYSGGGYTIMETAVEDMSGLPFEEYMLKKVLEPIGMDNSTFDQPLKPLNYSNVSAAYDSAGKLIDGLYHNYPEQAAAGLWTTSTDLAKYCIEIQEIAKGKSDGILTKQTVDMMLTKHQNDWGLGPSLKGDVDSLIFQHGGKNAGFTNNFYANVHTGDAVVVMTNADNGKKLIDEIVRAVCRYYELDFIDSPNPFHMERLSEQELSRFEGQYKLLRTGRELTVNIKRENGLLVFTGENIPRPAEFIPLNDYEFFDLENGNKVTFEINSDTINFLFNNRLQFYKK